jgi:acetyl-CoA carboxylase biotin carboxyl carrier protein
MNQKELKELIEFLIEKDIAEFELERGDVKVRVKRGEANPELRFVPARFVPAGGAVIPAVAASMAIPASAPATAAAPAVQAPSADDKDLFIVKSPIVGTFYESPSPGSPPFVVIGDTISVGQVLCIIEAMKLMNEIESEVTGEIVKKLVTNGQPVEYGQPLFAIRKS